MRTKTIFISDIHMGDNTNNSGQSPYVWFKKNVGLLAQFLSEKSAAPDVNEVVILGDLFDRWIVPADMNPITDFGAISSDLINRPVIDALVALAANKEIKLSYVPGNHDMALDNGDITTMGNFMQTTFPGINFVCDGTWPLGTYTAGPWSPNTVIATAFSMRPIGCPIPSLPSFHSGISFRAWLPTKPVKKEKIRMY